MALAGVGAWLFLAKGCQNDGLGRERKSAALDSPRESASGGSDGKNLASSVDSMVESQAPVQMRDLPSSTLTAVTGTGTTMLQVAFKTGVFTVLKREDVPNVEVRPMRAVEGMTGLYYRVLQDDGEVAFENIVADPRVLYWDTVSSEGRLAGGRLDNADQPVQIRLPFNAKGRLEVYLVSRIGWSRKDLSKEARLVGVFRL